MPLCASRSFFASVSTCVIALCVMSASPWAARTAAAQSISTAQLKGVVKDNTGAVIPGAVVTASDSSNGFNRTSVADTNGNFQLLLLPPGDYTVTATYKGFEKLVRRNVVLTVGEQAELPLALQVGGSDTVVEVTTGAEILETDRSSQSTVVNQVQITNLPTNGRNYVNFTLTNSQIARDSTPAVGAIPTSGLNFGGVNARSNSINLDGADSGDYLSGGTRSTVSQDAVQEFQIITNGFSAEYGRASGGVVNIVTKSGTNATHASAFGFLRNRYIQATNPFSNVYQPAYTRVQAGFTVGGAIKKDRTFYFFGTEITRREESGFSTIGAGNFGLVNTDVSRFLGAPTGAIVILATPAQQAFFAANPSAAGGSAAFQQYLATVASSSSIALTGRNPGFLQATFGPTGFASSGQPTPASFVALNSLVGNYPIQEKTEIYSLRIDHKLSAAHQLLLRGTASPSYVTGIQENASNQNFGQNSGSRTAEQRLHDWSILGQDTYLIDSSKVNEARFQFARHPVAFNNQNTFAGSQVAVNIPGFAYFGKTPFANLRRIEDQSQFQDNFTYTVHGHTLKFGVDVRYVLLDFAQAQTYEGGDYSFGGLQVAAGTPNLSAAQAYGLGVPQSFVQSIGSQAGKDNIDVIGAYAQDSYKFKRVTLNYGVRYDAERYQLKSAGNALTQNAFNAFGVVEGINTRLGNIAPRVGFAYDVAGTGKTVIRGNYGLFYNRAPGSIGPQAQTLDTYDNPLTIVAGGSPCTAASTASPTNLNATNLFQGSLANANCVPYPGLNYLPGQQRFDGLNSNSIFVHDNFLASGFPLAILPSGTLIGANWHTPYVQQISFGIEQDLGHNLSMNVAYNSTGGRHLTRPINLNAVNPQLLIVNFRNALAAVAAGTAAPATANLGTNPLTVATAAGTNPCGAGPSGPYVTPALLNFFRRGGLNNSLANFLTTVGAGQCVALAQQIAVADGLGVGVPVPFSDLTTQETTASSSYNGLSINVKKRFSDNFQFLASYTWAHAIDDVDDIVSTSDAPANNFNPNGDRSTSIFDQRHRFVLSGVYNTGHLTGKMLGSGFLPGVFSGFTIAPIFEVSSGRPFNIFTSVDSNFDFDSITDRPNAAAASAVGTTDACGNAVVASKYSPTGALSVPCYLNAPVTAGPSSTFYNGNLGRNKGIRPFVAFTDIRFAKAIQFENHLALQLTADAFNLINKNNTLDVNLLYTSAGQETSSTDPRQFQFGARLSF